MSPLIGIMLFSLNPNDRAGADGVPADLGVHAISEPGPDRPLHRGADASALMSTSDSSILAGASVATENLLPFFRRSRDLTDKEKLHWTRIMVVVIGLVSLAYRAAGRHDL